MTSPSIKLQEPAPRSFKPVEMASEDVRLGVEVTLAGYGVQGETLKYRELKRNLERIFERFQNELSTEALSDVQEKKRGLEEVASNFSITLRTIR